MDIQFYEDLFNGLNEHIKSLGSSNYGNKVLHYAPEKPTYPLTIFEEVKNVTDIDYNTPLDKLARVGYKIEIYAKTKGNVSKQLIARRIAKQVNDYLTSVGLKQFSYNPIPILNDNSIYGITIMYNGNLYENRRILI